MVMVAFLLLSWIAVAAHSISIAEAAVHRLHYAYQIAARTRNYEAFDQYDRLVSDAIEELMPVNRGCGYSSEPCSNSWWHPLMICSEVSVYLSSNDDLEHLGSELVNLMSDIQEKHGDQFSVTWVVVPQEPHGAEFAFDVESLDSSKSAFDAGDAVSSLLDHAVQTAGVQVDSGTECEGSPCHNDDDSDRCAYFSCFLYTVEKGMGPRVQAIVEQEIDVVNDKHEWFNVTYVPLDPSEVNITTNSGPLVEVAPTKGLGRPL